MISDFPLGLFALRHCKTEYNSIHKISGQSDIPIVDFSIDTSLVDLNNYQHKKIIIISSPLTRCVQTTNLFLKTCNEIYPQKIYFDSRIVERGMGDWEGKFKIDILNQYPQYNYFGHLNPLLTPPKGESLNNFITRIDKFIQDLQTISKIAPIIICAHNQSLKLLKYRLVGGDDLINFWISFSFKNGKIERIY